MTKKILHLIDRGQDLTELICIESGGFLKIQEVSEWCSPVVANIYIGNWILEEELEHGCQFVIFNPDKEFDEFTCRYQFDRLEVCEEEES